MTTDNIEYSTFTGWVDPPADIQPVLTGDLKCDVVVIGGGMGGMPIPRLATVTIAVLPANLEVFIST